MQKSKSLKKAYKTKELSAIVGIADSTVRKYSQALEKAGYSFIKDKNGNRLFSEKDIELFEKLKNFSIKSNVPLNYIAKIIKSSEAAKVSEQKKDSTMLFDSLKKSNENEISVKIDQLIKENFLLKEELKQLKKYLELDLRIKKERDQQLISLLNQFQNLHKDIISSKEKGKFLKKYLK